MSIGEALAAARQRAGLTTADVSASTRIRESVIHGIERDDYSGCGGDFYARGHIRAISHAVGSDPRPLIEEYDAARRASEAARPGAPAPAVAVRPPVLVRERRRVNWTMTLGLLVVAALGVAGYLYAAGGHRADPGAGARASTAARAHPAARPRSGRHSPGPAPSRSQSPPPVALALAPVSVQAFGPGGVGTGDDPQGAALAVGTSAVTAWRTDWYATAAFGGLQPGTGLLLDLGRPARIASLRLTLGQPDGTDLEIRAGDTPDLASLPVMERTTNAGGVVTFSLPPPVIARYVLIWLTKLPPDQAGTFEASIYDVRLTGQRQP